jgi:hypothetical protein
MSPARVLKDHGLFQALPADEVEAISRFSSVKLLKRGGVVGRENAPASRVPLVH